MGIFRERTNPQGDNFVGGSPLGRSGRYGELYVTNVGTVHEFGLADEGSSFVAISPTAGTGIIGHAAPTTFDETKPYLFLYNNGQNRIYPQFLRLYETVASVGGARVQFTLALDYGNRYSSGGTALVKNNVNADSQISTGLTAYAGAVVASAATANRRLLGNYAVRGTIDIIEDVYELNFGGVAAATSNHSRAATVASHGVSVPPVVIGPGQCLLIHQWAASQSTGPTWEVVLNYVER